MHSWLIEHGPVTSPFARRPDNPWSPPHELRPAWDAYIDTYMANFEATGQTPDECAASFIRAVSDPAPALRYMTHPPSEGLLRTKMVDLDGRGEAAATLSLLAARASEEGGGLHRAAGRGGACVRIGRAATGGCGV